MPKSTWSLTKIFLNLLIFIGRNHNCDSGCRGSSPRLSPQIKFLVLVELEHLKPNASVEVRLYSTGT